LRSRGEQAPGLDVLRLGRRDPLDRFDRAAEVPGPAPDHAFEEVGAAIGVEAAAGLQQALVPRRVGVLEGDLGQLPLGAGRALLHGEPGAGGQRGDDQQDPHGLSIAA
jgi:hypothetical protein